MTQPVLRPILGDINMEPPKPRIPEGLENALYFLLDRASSGVTEAVNGRLAKYRLSVRQFAALSILTSGNSNQQDLADMINVNRNAMVQIMDHLEQFGYAVRQINPNNRREHIVTISDKGKKIYEQAKKSVEEAHLACLEKLTSSEKKSLMDILQKVCVFAVALYSAPLFSVPHLIR